MTTPTEERLVALEEGAVAQQHLVNFIIASSDSHRAMLVALLATLSLLRPDWPAHLQRVLGFAGDAVDQTDFGNFPVSEDLRSMAIAYTSETFRRVGAALVRFERDTAAGHA